MLRIFKNSNYILNFKNRVKSLGLPVLGLLLALMYFYPIISLHNVLGTQDWDMHFSYNEFTRKSILEFGEFPFWNPYHCGGFPHFANPQVSVISIQTILILLFGTINGIKYSLVIHAVIGFIGTYILGRYFKLSRMSSILSSIIFCFSGITASYLSAGHIVFISNAFTPIILFLFINKNIRYSIYLSSIIFSLSFYFGYHISLLQVIMIILVTMLKVLIDRELFYLKRLIQFSLITLILTLPKLALSLQLLSMYPRYVAEKSGFELQSILYFFTSKNQSFFNYPNVAKYTFNISENSLYVGIIPTILFVIGVANILLKDKKKIFLVFLACILLWLMLGNTTEYSLYNLIKKLPILDSFRVAQRFRHLLILPTALIVGVGVDSLLQKVLNVKFRYLLYILVLSYITFDLFIFGNRNFLSSTLIIRDKYSKIQTHKRLVQQQLPYNFEYIESFPQKFKGDFNFLPWSIEFIALRQGFGIVECYEPFSPITKVKNIYDEDYISEAYVVPEAMILPIKSWSPISIKLDINNNESYKGMSVVINQNYYPGWLVRNNKSIEVAVNHNGLLSHPIKEPGNVKFYFSPYEHLLRK